MKDAKLKENLEKEKRNNISTCLRDRTNLSHDFICPEADKSKFRVMRRANGIPNSLKVFGKMTRRLSPPTTNIKLNDDSGYMRE